MAMKLLVIVVGPVMAMWLMLMGSLWLQHRKEREQRDDERVQTNDEEIEAAG
jgi:hypothetical protein